MNFNNKIVTILGPTAVGKTKFASLLAYEFGGEIISADSRQVYLGMDLGTGKDLDDYIINNRKINAHLIDIIKPTEEFNLFSFIQNFNKACDLIISNKKLPFLVGGTGLYLNSIIQNYSLNSIDFNSNRRKILDDMDLDDLKARLLSLNPKLHNTTDLKEKERIIKAILIAEEKNTVLKTSPKLEHLVIGLFLEREELKRRIRKRLKERLEHGMIEEVNRLLEQGITHEKLRFFGLEYKYLSLHISGELNYNDMFQKLASSIIKFSKRQMTWFRKMEKEGVQINWLKNDELEKAEKLIHLFTN